MRLLAFDPTPAGLISQPLRKAFKGLWERLRRGHFATCDLSCEICSVVEAEQRLIHGHEVYSFPDPTTIRLDRISFLCTRCHDTIHFERTRGRCQAPYVQTVTDHYCRVNGGLSQEEFKRDVVDTLNKTLGIRKSYNGTPGLPLMDYGPFGELVAQSMKRKAAWSVRGPRRCGEIRLVEDRRC